MKLVFTPKDKMVEGTPYRCVSKREVGIEQTIEVRDADLSTMVDGTIHVRLPDGVIYHTDALEVARS